jgi:ABC-type glutathione transport system ATPase component
MDEITSGHRDLVIPDKLTSGPSPSSSPSGAEDGSGDQAIVDSTDHDSTKENEEQIRHLVREYTRHSEYSTADQSPFNAEPGSRLHPDSENFSPRAWAKAMLKLRNEDSDRFMGRTAGVSFRNLSVYGFGTPTDYQKTVASIITAAVGEVRRWTGKGTRRIDILRNFEGLIRAGEMLVVLGPPGSGCSTFLKTIAGETHGYYLDKKAEINYQGIGWNQMHSNFRGEAIYTAEQDVHFPSLTVVTLFISLPVLECLNSFLEVAEFMNMQLTSATL